MVCLRGSEPCRQVVAVYLFGRLAVTRSVRPRVGIERPVPPHALTGDADAVISLHLHLLVFHAPPQPLHAHVIPPTAGAVHTDLDAMVFQESRELLARELAAWVRLEDVRIAVADQRLLDGLDAEVRRQGVRQPPRQHAATGPELRRGTQRLASSECT